MPWTFAHPAAVLPFRPIAGPGRLSFPALVTGSLVPDAGYHARLFDLASFAHTPVGILALCLPMGLALLLAWWWLREPVAALLPSPLRDTLLARPTALPGQHLRNMLLLALSIILGSATHVLWDAFTHEGQFFVRHIEVLQTPLFFALERQIRLFNLAQHASTLIGLSCLAVACRRRLCRYPASPAISAADRLAYRRMIVIGLLALASAAPLALQDADQSHGAARISAMIVRYVVHASTVFIGLVAVIAIWKRLKMGVKNL